jgi:hypothetical protein
LAHSQLLYTVVVHVLFIIPRSASIALHHLLPLLSERRVGATKLARVLLVLALNLALQLLKKLNLLTAPTE